MLKSDNINTYKYIRSEQENKTRNIKYCLKTNFYRWYLYLWIYSIWTRKNCTKRYHQQQQPSPVTQTKIGQYLEILKVPDQTYLTISGVVIFKFV